MNEYMIKTRTLSALERIAAALEALAGIDIGKPEALPVVHLVVNEDAPSAESVQPQTEQSAQIINADTLKALCLEMFRKDNANKGIIKGYLGEYGARKIADLSDDDMARVFERVSILGANYE